MRAPLQLYPVLQGIISFLDSQFQDFPESATSSGYTEHPVPLVTPQCDNGHF